MSIQKKRFINIPLDKTVVNTLDFCKICLLEPGPEVEKIFMLNSAEHEIFPAHKC